MSKSAHRPLTVSNSGSDLEVEDRHRPEANTRTMPRRIVSPLPKTLSGEAEGKLAVELFHGRESPRQRITGWGSQGPVFVVEWIAVTYLSELRLGLDDDGEGALKFIADLVYYDGIFYGDWSVISASLLASDPELSARVRPFEPERAVPPIDNHRPQEGLSDRSELN